jgi:hypothetical protein
MWIAMHKCMEAMLGISLYNCLYLKLAKTEGFVCFLFNKTREREDRTGLSWKRVGVGGWGGDTMYTYVSKCKNCKIKGGQKKVAVF